VSLPMEKRRSEMPNLLRHVRLFETLSERECSDLVQFMHEKSFAPGATVCMRGQYGNTMLVVLQGTLSAVVPGAENAQIEVTCLQAGAVVGEMFCIDPAPRPVTIVAKEATRVLEISREDLTKMRQEAPRTAAALVSAVFHEVLRRLRSVDERVDREIRAEHDHEHSDDRDSSGRTPDPWDACFARLRGSA
jgi:CRP/FNR family transcriptional regulator, cyclic AMP receptor protein